MRQLRAIPFFLLFLLFYLSTAFSLTLDDLLLMDEASFAGKIHVASDLQKKMLGECGLFEKEQFQSLYGKEKGRAIHICCILHSEQINQVPPLEQLRIGEVLNQDLELLNRTETEQVEKFYMEARVFGQLPPGMGQNFRKSLVAFNLLERLAPNASLTSYRLASTYLLQGNASKAQETFLDKNLSSLQQQKRDRRILDGEHFGISPSLFANPNQGIGIFIHAFDDRAFDLDWKVSLGGTATTRENFSLYTASENRSWIEPFTIAAGTGIFFGKDDYFGLGPDTVNSGKTVLEIEKFTLEVSLLLPVWEMLSVRFGLKMGQYHLKNPPLDITENAFYSGPFGELSWDTRDSEDEPHRGGLLTIRGYFGQAFEKWISRAQVSIPIKNKIWFTGLIGMAVTSGRAPFSEYPSLGGTLSIPGTLAGRFRDSHLLAGYIEGKYQVFGPLTVGVFSSAGNVESQWNKLISSSMKLGAGICTEWRFSKYRKKDVRLEIGFHSGEALVNAGLGMVF